MSKNKKSKKKNANQKKKRQQQKQPERSNERARPSRATQNANLRAILTWSVTIIIGFTMIAGIGAFTIIGYGRLYENRIFPGVRVLDIRLDGLTGDEARTKVHEAIDVALKDGLRFRYDGRDIVLEATTLAPNDPDASRDLIRYDVEESIVAAVSYGRSGSVLQDTLYRWKARVHPACIGMEINVDDRGITEAIQEATVDQVPSVQNAVLDVAWNAARERAVTTIHESSEGRELDLETAIAKLHEQSETLSFAPIELQSRAAHPSITKEDIEPLLTDVQTWVDYAPFTLTYDGDAYTVSKKRFATWIEAVERDGDVALSIDPAFFHKDVRALAPIEQVANKGSLVIENDQVMSFKAGTIGYEIKDEPTLKGILQGLGTSSTFPLVVERIEASLHGQDPERLGIKEIIGIGRSNFAGSPRNRVKNIALGVEKVNGSLIAPGEEFSLLETLGPVTAGNGWLPELVIKGNKTVPEYGGGLCQIGTTTFRAAIQSGMKITERRNHSFRVSYYEPAGTDATIYEPRPDFRFVNDMDNHVLIHAYIVGTEVIYEFWGTDDGREVYVGKPSIYNITAPPPMKLIETTDLEPGKKRCTESAVAGADAALDYKITYADGTVHEETFYSHYRPWQAVCLVGVEELSEDSGGVGDEEGESTDDADESEEEPMNEAPPPPEEETG